MLKPLTKQKKCQIDKADKIDKINSDRKADKAVKVNKDHKLDVKAYKANSKLNSSAFLSIPNQ